MVAVHFIYDLTEIYAVLPPQGPVFQLIKNRGGTAFLLLSGISAVLGHRPLMRGLTVLGCALAVSAVTALAGVPVRFGVLHCLGVCMTLWTLFRKLPSPPLLFLGAAIVLTGAVFERISVSMPFLYPLGLCRRDFASADYFPLFPCFGYFLLGAVLGRKLYPCRRSLLPCITFDSPLSRFFRFCGTHALPVYLFHQPVLLAVIETAYLLGGNLYEA